MQTERPPRSFRVRRTALSGVDAVEADTARSFGRHMHDQFGIGLIDRGAQTSLSGRGIVEAGPGDIITVNPGEVHDGVPLADRISAGDLQHHAVRPGKLAPQCGPCLQHCADHRCEHVMAFDEVANTSLETSPAYLNNLEPE